MSYVQVSHTKTYREYDGVLVRVKFYDPRHSMYFVELPNRKQTWIHNNFLGPWHYL